MKYIASEKCHSKDVNCFNKYKEPLLSTVLFPPHLLQRECMYWRIFPSRSIDFSVNILPSKALFNMTQTDVLLPEVLSPRMFCPPDVLSPDVLSCRTFCLPDVLSVRTFCPAGRFVPLDVLSTDVLSPDVLSLDILSGHPKN